MHVVCPHAGPVATETAAALDASGFHWDRADVSGTPTSYTRLLACLWAAGEPFAIVEHDMAPHPGALAELEACPEPWCAFPYQIGAITHAGLGCARFSAALLAACPDAVSRTWGEWTEANPAGHWCSLDDRLSRSLRGAGFTQHVHAPQVKHLNPWPSHGCSDLGDPVDYVPDPSRLHRPHDGGRRPLRRLALRPGGGRQSPRHRADPQGVDRQRRDDPRGDPRGHCRRSLPGVPEVPVHRLPLAAGVPERPRPDARQGRRMSAGGSAFHVTATGPVASAGGGILHAVVIGTAGTSATLTLYDGTDDTGPVITVITPTEPASLPLGSVIVNGLYAKVTGTDLDATVVIAPQNSYPE